MFDIINLDENIPLLYYEGNFRILSARCITNDIGLEYARIFRDSDFFSRMVANWEDVHKKWEDHDYNPGLDKKIQQVLIYEYGGIQNIYKNLKKNPPKSSLDEANNDTINKILEKRGKDGFK